MTQEIVVREPQPDHSPAAMMMTAIEKGLDLEKVAQAMELQRQWDELQAKKEFYRAVAAFKRESIDIKKDKQNTQFKSWYSTLGNLLDTVSPYLGKHGLSVSFDVEQAEKITVKCILRHELGHTESVSLSAPPDTSGGNSKNPIQQIKSTFTYLRSATFEAVTGLAATEASCDDDGNMAAHISYITPGQVAEINERLKETGADVARFLKWARASSVEDIRADKYAAAIQLLKAKEKKSDRVPGQEG